MNRRMVIVGAVVVGAGVGLTWALWPRADAQMAKVEALQEKIAAAMPEPGKMPDPADFAANRETFREFREEFEKLSVEQQREFLEKNPPPMMREFQETIATFSTLPPEERNKFLDKQIDEMERMRKQFEQMAAAGGFRGFGGGQGANAGGPGGAAGGANSGGSNSAGQANADGTPDGPPRERMTREQRTRRMIDLTTPEQRAQMSEYFRALDQRRVERGMPSLRGQGFF